MEEVVAGLDVGTSSIKLVLYKKNTVFYVDRVDSLHQSSNGQEIDAVVLLHKIISLLQKTIQTKPNLKIKAIGLSTLFPSFIALDKNGRPLTKVITWMDNRGEKQIEKYRDQIKKTQKQTGCVIHQSYTLWKILWLKENEKDLFKKVDKFLTLSDYLIYQLTGKFILSYALASTTGFFNIYALRWEKAILKIMGISEKQLSKPASIYHTELLIEDVRKKLGAKKDILLVIGAGDGELSNIATGCLTQERMCSSIGTSSALRVIGDNIKNCDSTWKYYLYDKRYIRGISTNAGASSLAWFYNNVFQKETQNLFKNIDAIDMDHQTEMFFLPFLDGERGPNYHHSMTAALFGLTSQHTQQDIQKAVIEGIIFNLYYCYCLLTKGEGQPKEVVATGGYIYSKKILQMQADIFNADIVVPEIQEASAVGAAIIASLAIGDILSLQKVSLKIKKRYQPNPQKHRKYMQKYNVYKKMYQLYQEWYDAKLNSESPKKEGLCKQ